MKETGHEETSHTLQDEFVQSTPNQAEATQTDSNSKSGPAEPTQLNAQNHVRAHEAEVLEKPWTSPPFCDEAPA